MSSEILNLLFTHLPEAITSVSTCALALIGYMSLTTWKKQIEISKKIELIDHLITSILQYTKEIGDSLGILHYIEISINSHSETALQMNNSDNNAGILEYIRRNGEKDGHYLLNNLLKTRTTIAEIQLLSFKCKAFWSTDFSQCNEKILDLKTFYNQIYSIGIMICNPLYNWDNPEVEQVLIQTLANKSDKIETNLVKQSNEILEMLSNFYRK